MRKDISLFYIAYNEEENIVKAIRSAEKFLRKHANRWEVIVVVYEASADRTIDIVKEHHKKDKRIRLVIQKRSEGGTGRAYNIGLASARYPYIFYSDADNQFNVMDFARFLPYVDDYDVIAGFRIQRKDPFMRILAAKVYNLLIRLIFHVKERDVDCAFRYVNRKVLKRIRLTSNTGLSTSELLIKARRAGFKIREIGVRHYPRPAGSTTLESGLNIPRWGVIRKLLKDISRLRKELKQKSY